MKPETGVASPTMFTAVENFNAFDHFVHILFLKPNFYKIYLIQVIQLLNSKVFQGRTQ